MLKITVHSPALRTQPYTNKKGQPAELHFQTFYVHTCDAEGNALPYPEKIEGFADRDESGRPRAYPAGDYTLHPSAFSVRDGRLAVALRLTPVGKLKAAA